MLADICELLQTACGTTREHSQTEECTALSHLCSSLYGGDFAYTYTQRRENIPTSSSARDSRPFNGENCGVRDANKWRKYPAMYRTIVYYSFIRINRPPTDESGETFATSRVLLYSFRRRYALMPTVLIRLALGSRAELRLIIQCWLRLHYTVTHFAAMPLRLFRSPQSVRGATARFHYRIRHKNARSLHTAVYRGSAR